MAQKLLIVSPRLEWEARTVSGDFQGDGIVTRNRTFQKFFAQDELRAWIQQTTGRSCVAAAPGVFYVFRHTADEQTFLAARLTQPRRLPRARLSDELFHEHQDILQPLMAFISERGRLPRDVELEAAPRIRDIFGGIPRAFSLIRRVTGADHWEATRRQRRDDLLVYLALAAFRTRPRFGQLPTGLRYDIRGFFRTYKTACTEANRLLYSAGDQDAISRACAKAPVGKVLPDALYVHYSALSHLPPLLRAYEGCGRQLAGSIDGMTLVNYDGTDPGYPIWCTPNSTALDIPPLPKPSSPTSPGYNCTIATTAGHQAHPFSIAKNSSSPMTTARDPPSYASVTKSNVSAS